MKDQSAWNKKSRKVIVISGETIPVLLKCYGSIILPVCQYMRN